VSSIKFSATATASAATSITVSFGGSPAVGDLVVVFLLTDNEIIVHQPGYASEFTSAPNPWFMMESLRAPDASTLRAAYHTWNASDSGSSVVFTFVPAPTLGIGDKDVSTANAVAVAAVFNGANSTAILEHNIYSTAQDLGHSVSSSPLKKAAGMVLHCAAANGTTAGVTDSDSGAFLVQAAVLSTAAGGMTMYVYSQSPAAVGYAPTFSINLGAPAVSMASEAVSVSDNQPQLYNAPFIEEAPMGMNALMARYRLNRYFTVLNNGGIFSAQRYQSTDQIAAATQVFVNNQPITSTDRTNILNSGVGGDFLATS
jgi:hypothetical protein